MPPLNCFLGGGDNPIATRDPGGEQNSVLHREIVVKSSTIVGSEVNGTSCQGLHSTRLQECKENTPKKRGSSPNHQIHIPDKFTVQLFISHARSKQYKQIRGVRQCQRADEARNLM